MAIALLFVPIFGAVASAVAYLLSQICVLLIMGWHVKRSGILNKKGVLS